MVFEACKLLHLWQKKSCYILHIKKKNIAQRFFFFVAVPNIIIIIVVAAAAVGVAWAGSGGAGKWVELWSLWLCAFFAPSRIPV